ncbi:hypothetical protein BSK56_24185 [Paenibacillus borealis]|uniref:Deacetylase PdaC domain-containing protein n=1 Tax=Paenibacillus borealis TaxID=160799 RepID=A0ABX3H139_PAEBO|nr:hypothetical protein [Paenibacillus borealis]OMD43203.1 hypothetical protein BSK56_24185 [Paenibacillus borealis]
MRGKVNALSVMLLITLLITSCSIKSVDINSIVTQESEQVQVAQKTTVTNNGINYSNKQDESQITKSLSYSIVNESYTDKDISIRYPQVTGIDDSKKEEKINKLLKFEALVPLDDDLSSTEGYDLSMDIDYEVTWKSENLLSVQYKGFSYSDEAAYPLDLFYTINVDIKYGKKVGLSDVIKLDTRFVHIFREHLAKNIQDDVVKSYFLERTSSEELLKYLNGADSSFEISNFAFSYFTKDSLGISLAALHGTGDHNEFELKYQDVKEFLNTENEVWKEFALEKNRK